jgi:hypothetical protein
MSDPTKKPYISPSQLEMYTRCGESYRRRYVLGERIPPGVAAVRGTAIHKGAELNYAQKIKTHVDMTESQVVEIAASTFDEKVKNEGVWLSPDEQSAGEKIVVGEAKDTTVTLAGLMARESLPRFQPAEVEVTGRLEIPTASHDLLGRLDLVDERDFIVDFKTSSRKKNQADVDGDTQFTFYDLLFRAAKGRAPKGIIIENLVNKKVPEALTLATSRTLDDTQALVNRVNTMIHGLKAGVFMPSPAGSWNCSPRWCGYWASCPLVNNKRVIGGVS